MRSFAAAAMLAVFSALFLLAPARADAQWWGGCDPDPWFGNWGFWQMQGYNSPVGWYPDQWGGNPQGSVSFNAIPGEVSIHAWRNVDARWIHETRVCPGTTYLLEGDLRTQNVEADRNHGVWNAGASLRVLDTVANGNNFAASSGLVGTNWWTHVSTTFNTGPQTVIHVGPSLGIYSGMGRGTVWARNLRLTWLRW